MAGWQLANSAGSRDSALTAHGVLQARRLGAHLAANGDLVITHVFSSNLQRASATASAIVDALRGEEGDGDDSSGGDDGDGNRNVVARTVMQLADLREKDFRSGEGVRLGTAGRNAFADAETRDDMRVRAERFIDRHLLALLRRAPAEGGTARQSEKKLETVAQGPQRAVVVVAHGIILNVLLSSLLTRYAPAELSRLQPPSVPLPPPPVIRRPDLRVSWNNTGFVDIAVKTAAAAADADKQGDAAPAKKIRLQVTRVNSVEHLDGLKKTRGGIGSAKFDAKQKTMDAFFGPAAKRQKREDA